MYAIIQDQTMAIDKGCGMNEPTDPRALRAGADAALERTASQLRDILKALAGQLQPFPAFMNMASIQAVEVEPEGLQAPDRGCVVVCPDGQLYELSLGLMQGNPEVSDVDQVEEYQPLDLPPQEYILYASAAITALTKRMESTAPSL